ncbi:hypothetical protein NNA36_12170 [Shimia sp. CNT1-13L.2]|uniref:hypothetical protein n=1 Tax=Shimia sp. CNT1-13L.2 TaxID=2959663 RepID=UPI0020CD6534|nr:hypothetical protein [Shimia sp. CNT1-13L.2]MCP9482717.1 hypothetical protein [Shimia sp. CNT1-13L.2]
MRSSKGRPNLSPRLHKTIEIVAHEIPSTVKAGTKLYTGFEALRSCDGKTYQEFRDMCGGPKGDPNRRFSPSVVWRSAEDLKFARFYEDAPSEDTSANEFRLERQIKNTILKTSSSNEFPELNDVRQLCGDWSISEPGIYSWEIEGRGVYVGKYTRKSRPLSEYNKNVRNLLNGKPYRRSKPDGFREIHRALAEAVTLERTIILKLVENCPSELLNERERHWIAQIARGDLNR